MNEPKKILIVEKDAATRELLAQALADEGHVVRTVASAPAALAELASIDFDLLVTNYYLGGATGTWLARIAADSSRVHIPRVLILSGGGDIACGDTCGSAPHRVDVPRFLAEVTAVLRNGPAFGAREPVQRIALTLYCSGSLPSQRAKRRLTEILNRYAPEQVALTVIDISQDDAPVDDDRVVATPTLLRTFPGPRLWIAGDLEHESALRKVLEQAGVDAR